MSGPPRGASGDPVCSGINGGQRVPLDSEAATGPATDRPSQPGQILPQTSSNFPTNENAPLEARRPQLLLSDVLVGCGS